jgi:hypothetical protein
MNESSIQTNCFLNSKANLAKMRQESWITEPDRVAVDRSIASLDRLIANSEFDEYRNE